MIQKNVNSKKLKDHINSFLKKEIYKNKNIQCLLCLHSGIVGEGKYFMKEYILKSKKDRILFHITTDILLQ